MRAAFEHARLLYSLNPSEDPHGALLHLDYLAPRSGMNDWLLKFLDTWEKVDSEEPTGEGAPRLNPKFLPGMAYAKALAMWSLENQTGDKVPMNLLTRLRGDLSNTTMLLRLMRRAQKR